MPPETVEAYRDHGDPKVRIRELCEPEDEGVRNFSVSFDALLAALAQKQEAVNAGRCREGRSTRSLRGARTSSSGATGSPC